MPREFSTEEADRHNALHARGWALIEGQILLQDGQAHRPPGYFGRRKLSKALRCFEQALQINPEGWSSMWATGKIHQRLGDHRTSLTWFARAHEIDPTQVDVAREAGFAALECGEAALAIRFCAAAVEAGPEDPGLLANLALAHMLSGDDNAAVECARSAVERDPDDPVAESVLELVQEVARGTRARPRTLQDI